MKVVLFCGGYGMRMRDETTSIPKPMAMIGDRPLLWNVMRYYAHFGHKDFILCLGYGANAVKDYFLHYDETRSNDFVLTDGGGSIELLSSDIEDWRITFVDTGLNTAIGERLRRVRHLVEGEEMFFANYADVLTDLPLDTMIDWFVPQSAGAGLLAVNPQAVFHVVDLAADQRVTNVYSASTLPIRMNGGYLILRPEVFDVLQPGADLVGEAFQTLAERERLVAYPYDGFWMPADTLKERAQLEEMYRRGDRPWALWDHRRNGARPSFGVETPH